MGDDVAEEHQLAISTKAAAARRSIAPTAADPPLGRSDFQTIGQRRRRISSTSRETDPQKRSRLKKSNNRGVLTPSNTPSARFSATTSGSGIERVASPANQRAPRRLFEHSKDARRTSSHVNGVPAAAEQDKDVSEACIEDLRYRNPQENEPVDIDVVMSMLTVYMDSEEQQLESLDPLILSRLRTQLEKGFCLAGDLAVLKQKAQPPKPALCIWAICKARANNSTDALFACKECRRSQDLHTRGEHGQACVVPLPEEMRRGSQPQQLLYWLR